MKITVQVLTFLTLMGLIHSLPCYSQQLQVEGAAAVGTPGEGNTLLTLVSEREWAFRQFGTDNSASLELADLTGLKNFLINTTGNVGIGFSSPVDKLHVNGNIRAVGPRISFGTSEYFEDGGGFIINCNGSIIPAVDGGDDLGSQTNRWRNIWASNGTIMTSDAKLKSNIRDISYGLQDILKLHPISFTWKDQPNFGPKLGLIAQEVQAVIGEVVVDHQLIRSENQGEFTKVPSEYLGMLYTDLIPVLIKGIQEQQELIRENETRIALLQTKADRIDALEERLSKLERLSAGQGTSSLE